MRLITFMLLLIAPSFVAAEIWDDNAKLTDLGKINIAISDTANGGCWTNISEVRSYINDKLDVMGITVTDDRSNKFRWLSDGLATFRVKVNASRIQNVVCVGSYAFDIIGVQKNEQTGIVSIVQFSTVAGILWNDDNLNIQLLDVAGKAIREWEDQR